MIATPRGLALLEKRANRDCVGATQDEEHCMTATAAIPMPQMAPNAFSISITVMPLENDQVRLTMTDSTGAEILTAADMTLNDAIRMIRLKLVILSSPVQHHDRLLRGF